MIQWAYSEATDQAARYRNLRSGSLLSAYQ